MGTSITDRKMFERVRCSDSKDYHVTCRLVICLAALQHFRLENGMGKGHTACARYYWHSDYSACFGELIPEKKCIHRNQLLLFQWSQIQEDSGGSDGLGELVNLVYLLSFLGRGMQPGRSLW